MNTVLTRPPPTAPINGTACAIGRTLLFIMENHQQDDGVVEVPDVLRPYCNGLEKIAPPSS